MLKFMFLNEMKYRIRYLQAQVLGTNGVLVARASLHAAVEQF